jgi:hypothetical protein
MNLIRPELRLWLTRWGETLGAGVLASVGALTIWRGVLRYNWLTQSIGATLLFIGLGLFWVSFQRSRFSGRQIGPGLVEVTERQIRFMTANGGSAVDIAAMTRLELRTTIEYGRVWMLKQSEGPTLFIPVATTGSEKLFDAFSILPGMDPAKLIAAINSRSTDREIIWRGSTGFRALT